jgi:hypothetical protein
MTTLVCSSKLCCLLMEEWHKCQDFVTEGKKLFVAVLSGSSNVIQERVSSFCTLVQFHVTSYTPPS